MCRNILLLSTPSTPLRYPSLPRATLNNQPPTTHSPSRRATSCFSDTDSPPSRLPNAFLLQVACFAEFRLLRCCTVHWLSHPRVRGPDVILHGRRASWSRIMEGGSERRRLSLYPIGKCSTYRRNGASNSAITYARSSIQIGISVGPGKDGEWDVSVERLGVSIN